MIEAHFAQVLRVGDYQLLHAQEHWFWNEVGSPRHKYKKFCQSQFGVAELVLVVEADVFSPFAEVVTVAHDPELLLDAGRRHVPEEINDALTIK